MENPLKWAIVHPLKLFAEVLETTKSWLKNATLCYIHGCASMAAIPLWGSWKMVEMRLSKLIYASYIFFELCYGYINT